MFIPFLNALMNGLFCFVHILHDKPIPVGAIAVNGVWLHGLCAPSVVSTYSVYVGVDIQVDEVAFGQFVRMLFLFRKPLTCIFHRSLSPSMNQRVSHRLALSCGTM